MLTIILEVRPQERRDLMDEVAAKLKGLGFGAEVKEGFGQLRFAEVTGASSEDEASRVRFQAQRLYGESYVARRWDEATRRLLDRAQSTRNRRHLTALGSWDYELKPASPVDWQRLLLWGATGGEPELVRLALQNKANPRTGIFYEWAEPYPDGQYYEFNQEQAYKWEFRANAKRNAPKEATVRLPLEGAVAGANTAVIEALLPGLPEGQVTGAINWITKMEPNLPRYESGIALASCIVEKAKAHQMAKAEPTHGQPGNRTYDCAWCRLETWLRETGEWLRCQPNPRKWKSGLEGPSDERWERVVALHRQLARISTAYGFDHMPPVDVTAEELL